MGRVRDIFRLVAVEGKTLHAVKRALEKGACARRRVESSGVRSTLRNAS